METIVWWNAGGVRVIEGIGSQVTNSRVESDRG